MRTESNFLRSYLSTLIVQVIAWAFPLVWILSIPPKNHARDAQKTNEINLARAHKIIEFFQRDYKTLPDSMTELKAYSRSKKYKSDFYDAFGNPLEYILLSERDYIVRSFGRDGSQNTLLLGKDDAGSSFKRTPRETPRFKYWQGAKLAPYPAVLVSGSNSPNNQWYGKIFSNFKDGKRRLVVYHKKKRSFFMVARHDAVEEFLWLPSGYGVIFTATSSNIYRDGIYYWDLLEDELVNLLTAGSMDANLAVPTNPSNEYMISLAGIEIDGSKAYFFLVNKNYGDELNPLDFYSSEALVSATIPINSNDRIKLARAFPDSSETLFDLDQPVLSVTGRKSLSLRIQYEWLRLGFDSEDIYQDITQWQKFAEKHSQTSLLPYTLFHIMNLYHSAYTLSPSQSDKELTELRSYGSEMAKALKEYPLAPSYLKAMAKFSYRQIMNGEAITFKSSLLKQSRLEER